jgi:hypothetical protein
VVAFPGGRATAMASTSCFLKSLTLAAYHDALLRIANKGRKPLNSCPSRAASRCRDII